MSILEKFKDKKIYMVHDSDLDGTITGLLGDYYIQSIASKFIRYSTAERSLPEYNWLVSNNSDIVIFADIAPPDLQFYNKIKENSEVFIFDHHRTSKQDLGELPNYFYSEEKCASKILFDELTRGQRVKKIISQLVQLTNVYDCYLIDDISWRSAKGLNNILYGFVDWRKAKYQTDVQKNQRFINVQIKKFEKGKDFYFTLEEREKAWKAEQKERDNYQQAKKTLKIRTDNQGNKYGYFECSAKVSWVASLLLREYPQIKYFVCHSTFLETYQNEENGKLSLRSQIGFDVGAIAKKYLGGGHGVASGLELPIDKFYELREGKLHLI